MAPLTPFWEQPSHGDRQVVFISEEGFTSKSFSKITLPPFSLFARLSFPPCTKTEYPTYATVQMDRNTHLNLNSDLIYINHSCDPSLIFDIPTYSILAGPRGLHPGTELTFFYPSTEWSMAQTFDCLCGAPTCLGKIGGAKDMAPKQLEGFWLSGFIRDMLEERSLSSTSQINSQKTGQLNTDLSSHGKLQENAVAVPNGKATPVGQALVDGPLHDSTRNSPTSRELSGETDSDTQPASST